MLTRALVLIRQLKLIFRFYKELALANLLVTLACAYLTKYFGEKAREILGILIWFKLITIFCFLYFVLQRKRSELYYYQNLGVTKTQIGIWTSLFDFTIFLLIVKIFLK